MKTVLSLTVGGCILLLVFQTSAAGTAQSAAAHYPVVGTGQSECYSEGGDVIRCPTAGTFLSGQDPQHPARRPSYADNGDGTVTDRVTGLVWAKAPSAPMAVSDLDGFAQASRLGGHADWRVPTIRELYSLIDYRGGYSGDPRTSRPYLDTSVFDFAYGAGTGLGDAAHGRRPIDVQEWSATRYVGRTMGGDETVFGVNFADGRIKGYPVMDPGNRMQTPNRLAVRLVRGPSYGRNDFHPDAETVTDRATGLVWQRRSVAGALRWADALAYCGELSLDGHRDWRLPNAKELHSIVDYSRIPAIDPLFEFSDRLVYLWSSLRGRRRQRCRTAPFHGPANLPCTQQSGRQWATWRRRPDPGGAAGSTCTVQELCEATRRRRYPARFRSASARKAMTFADTTTSSACAHGCSIPESRETVTDILIAGAAGHTSLFCTEEFVRAGLQPVVGGFQRACNWPRPARTR